MMIVYVILVVVIILVFIYYSNKEKEEQFISDTDQQIINQLKNKLYTISPELVNIPIAPGNESVTVDKKKIYICMKDATDNYYPLDTLIYVLLHEIAHIQSKSYSFGEHNKEFQQKFKELLEKAYKLNILPQNIDVVPVNYCKKEKRNWVKSLFK
jgi:hypothetical protein